MEPTSTQSQPLLRKGKCEALAITYMGYWKPDRFLHDSGEAGTPISLIASRFRQLPQCTALLLDAGADPSIPNRGKSSLYPHSPLSIALENAIQQFGSPLPTVKERSEHILKRMISSSLLDLTTPAASGRSESIWLSAFLEKHPPSSGLVERLLEAGCDINETAVSPKVSDGRNCLFLLVLDAWMPGSSREFETLRLLLRRRANVFARDASGLTVFDRVNASSSPLNEEYWDYRRDLWFCALRREGIDTGQAVMMHPGTFAYNDSYALEHYRALCYLDTWTEEDLSQKIRKTLEAFPSTEEEKDQLTRIRVEKERKKKKFVWANVRVEPFQADDCYQHSGNEYEDSNSDFRGFNDSDDERDWTVLDETSDLEDLDFTLLPSERQ